MNRKVKILLPVLISAAIIIGIFLGLQIGSSTSSSSFKVSPINLYQSDKLSLILRMIEKDYVDSIDKKELVESIIPKLLEELDPHTSYIPAKEMQGVNEEMRGNFSGIGVQFVMQNDTVMVVDVVSGGPSQKLGILAGDRIVKVNDRDVSGVGFPSDTIVSLLRGKKGTQVQVGIQRQGLSKLLDFDIVRGEIPLYSVDISFMVSDQIGLIKINRFAETTYREFMNGLEQLRQQGATKLIIDLRGNSGGYLQMVFRMVEEFLPAKSMIVYTQGKSRAREDYLASRNGSWLTGDVAVLIDEFSASASEIFAGAIQDNDRGIVVGRRSFGKGLVQEQIPFVDGSSIRLTVARFYTPSGRSIQKPYDNGNDDYFMDIRRRIEHAELVEKDSIQLNDSLKYYTIGGREVYGGGGIMPDFFVPVDTSGVNNYFASVASKNLIYRFAFDYSDNNRKQLSSLLTVDELVKYLDQVNVYALLNKRIVSEGIKSTGIEMAESKKLIMTQLYAYISRNILGEQGFYPIIYKEDQTVQKAIELLKQDWEPGHIAKLNAKK